MKKPGPGGPLRQPGRSSASPWGPRRSYLLVTLAIIIAAPLMWMWNDHPPEPVPEHPPSAAPATATAAPAPDEPAPAASAAAPAAPTPAAQPPASPPTPSARVRDPDGDQTPDLADYLNPGERPTMAEVIERLHANGVHSGLGAFQPPGTRPPLVGLAVPEDFELPPGYVRHHQVTDEGEEIEAILMFSPDGQWVDANGQPLELPADRVVPPELAPPGLPIRQIVLPAPRDPNR